MIDITDRLTAAIAIAVVTGAGKEIAVMVGVVVKMKDIGGNDDDCEASAHDAEVMSGAGDERSEADGMRGDDAAGGGEPCGCERLARSTELKTDALAMSGSRTGPKAVGRPMSPSGAG